MRKLFEIAASIYAAFGGLGLLWTAAGQALTGGLALPARTAPEMMEPWSAVSMVVWLVCVVYCALRQLGRSA